MTTNVEPMAGHLPDEAVAAFAEGRLRGTARDEAVLHLSSCDDCRAIFDVIGDAQAAGVIASGNVVRGNFGRRAVAAALATAAAVAVVMLTPATRDWIDVQRTGGVSQLVEGYEQIPMRPIKARLGDFPYKKPTPDMRGGATIDDETIDDKTLPLLIAVAKVQKRGGQSVKRLRAQGLAQLLDGRHGEAIATLERALAEDGDDPLLRSDLAAAYLERARWVDTKTNLEKALTEAERALTLKRTPEAAWNRALALELLRRTDDAIRAWQEYLVLDDSSPWAAEARSQHLDPLQQPDIP